MENDEDYEPILEGSALYMHLKEVNFDGMVETFSAKKEVLKSNFNKIDDYEGMELSIPQENYELTNLLLHSNLMLEEDAAYLYSLVSTLQIKQCLPRWKPMIIPGGILTVACLAYLKMRQRVLMLPVILGSITGSLIYLKHIYTRKQKLKRLTKLLSTLNSVLYYIKKNIKQTRELGANIVTMEFTSAKDDPVAEMYYERTREQIISVMKDLTCNIINIILATRKTTLSFGSILSKFSVLNIQLLSSLTDEQLGLKKFEHPTDYKDSLNIESLDVLKNIYILIQSEYLKMIGLCFTSLAESSIDTIFTTLDKDFQNYFVILEKMKLQYNCSFLPKRLTKELNIKSKKLADGCQKLKIFNSLLSALILESDNLESYLEKYPETSNSDVQASVCQIDKKLNDCTEYFKEVSNHFQRSKCVNKLQEPSEPSILQKNEANDTKIIQLGYSDFSVRDVDKVYLCVSEEREENDVDCSNDNPDDDNSPQLPVFVLSELKQALTVKKVEFQQRELEAAQRNNMNDEYAQFLCDENPILNKSSQSANNRKQKTNENLSTESNLNSNVPAYSNGAMSFQKMVALKAVNTSLAWNNCQDEVIYDENKSEEYEDCE
ncbi:uncharacterized protein LOC106671107 [Cimex lectularius]|uniref:Vezatin n=1 Tax=Cimex lectularius TaxID=79782 RepID=A0A8I6S7N0_CIMLE|nr:uncharacterized protein LOC106671107 [Cimex lectularius]